MKNFRIALLLTALGLALAILALVLPAIGQSGDYGIATGAGGGCGHTHYCTPTPVITGTPGTPFPTATVELPTLGTG